jgi:hypothetical protein
MHLLAPASKVVLTPGVALSLLQPRLAKIIFPVSEPYDLNCVHQVCFKPNQTKQKINYLNLIFFQLNYNNSI